MPDVTARPAGVAKRLWAWLRAVSGDDAYERYVAHWRAEHGESGEAPLDRKSFFRQCQDEQWNGIRRCC
jgi:uncharacterized short protein YbdD (DUF466 family)